MKKVSILIAVVMLGSACASRPHVVNAANGSPSKSTLVLSQADLKKIDKTIANINSEIDQLQSLNDKMYERSLTADPTVEKEFQKKLAEYGSFESLQADLRILADLKSQTSKRGLEVGTK